MSGPSSDRRKGSRQWSRQYSLDNLVELANAQEAFDKGKKLVWRAPGAAPVVVESLEECLEHGAIGGLRAGALAYGIRAGINIFLVLFTLTRTPKRFRIGMIQHALFGAETFRFSSMIGTFTAVYKVILNSLPILARYLRRRTATHAGKDRVLFDKDSPPATPDGIFFGRPALEPHLSQATKEAQDLAHQKGLVYRPWHAAFAGSVAAGLAILLERPKNRSSVGQQMFVRGLQGLYNVWSARTGVTIPFGSALVFWLCCGQISYCYLMKPQYLRPWYDSWIQSMSVVPVEGVKINRSMVLTGRYDPDLLARIVDGRARPWKATEQFKLITPKNRAGMISQLVAARNGIFEGWVAPCEALHPHRNSCTSNTIMRVVESGSLLLPVYGALHLIPALLFKRKAFLKQPLVSVYKVIAGTLRSSAFIGVFVAILQAGVCGLGNIQRAGLPPHLHDFFHRLSKSQLYWWLFASLSGLSVLIEEKHRREELAMYVLPKAGESAWVMFREEYLGMKAKRKGAWKADVGLSAAGMGMVMTIYQSNPGALSGLVRRILYQFVGPN